jgi:hypothetical protein
MSAGLTPYSSHYFNSNDPRFRFTSSSDGQIIIFDTTINKWVNADPSSISPTLDPNCMVYTDSTGTLSTSTLFTFDETTGVVSQELGYGGLDMRLVKELKFKQDTLKGQPIHLQEQGNSGIIEGVLSDNADPDLMPSVGIAMLDYLNNETGYVVRNGRVVDIVNDASVFDVVLTTGSSNVSKVIYVNGLGKLTLVRPNGPLELVQNIGQIVRVSGSGIDILVQGAGRTNDIPNTISITGDITCDTLHYNQLDPAIPSPNDTAITLQAGTSLNGGGVINLNQATPETITFDVDVASLNIPAPANDATITIASLSPFLTGGGNFTTDQSTNETINLSLDTASSPAPNTIATRDANGDLSCNTLNYNFLVPAISGSANDATITLNAGSGLSGGGNFTTNQSVNETITFSLTNPVENATITLNAGSGLSGGGNFTTNQSVNETITFNSTIDPANDATITIASLSPFLTGGGNFTTDQATNETINLSLDTASAPAPNTIATRDANGDLSCNALNYSSLVPAINIPTVNDTAITLTAGSFLSGGGVLNLNQATPETITFNVDSVSLKNSIGAFDSTITLGTTGALTGGGFFTVDASDNKTINFGTNGTSDATPDTLVLRDASGNFSVNELTYTSLNPPISPDIIVSDIDNAVVPAVEKWTIQSPAILSYKGFLNDGTGTNLRSATYSDDGSKLITITFNNTSKQYALSSPFDITTASLTSQPAINRPSATGITFTTDGLYYVLVRNITTDRATLYQTATPYTITGATELLDQNIISNGGIATPISATFADNDKLFIADVNGEVSRYTFNRNNNTITFDTGTNIDIGANHSGIMIKPDGTRFFVISSVGVLSEYELTTSYDISTRVLQSTTYDLINLIPSGDRPSTIVEQDLKFSRTLGEEILLSDSGNGRVYQFTLTLPPALNYTFPTFVSSTSGVQNNLYVDDVLKYETTTKTLEVNKLKYNFLDPPISSGDATITLTAGTSLNGGGTFTTDQATNAEITLNVDVASLNIPAPANDSTITIVAGTSLNGGGTFTTDQATNGSITLNVDTASLNIPAPANDTAITFTAGTSLNGGGVINLNQATIETVNFDVDVASLNIPAPSNDSTISIVAGTSLNGGGTFTTDQATNGSITLNVDTASLNIPAPANDTEITIAVSNGLTGGGAINLNQATPETINITTNATSLATPDTLVLRDASGNFSVNELTYTSLNPPIATGGDLTVVDVDTVPPPPVPETEKWTIQSPVVVSYVGYYSVGIDLRGATYNDTGTKLYTAETTTDRVRQYALSSPYLVSTAVLEATVSVGTNTRSLDFRPDGTYFATVRNISSDACVIYECIAGAWDITGAVQRSSFNINTSGLIAGPQSVSWVGNERIFIGDINGEISTFLFNEGSKTISYVANTNLDTGDNIGGISFKPDGTKMFKLLQTGIIQEYDLAVPYSYTVANRTLLSTTYDVINGIPAQDRPNAIVEWDIKFSNTYGNNLIVSDGANGRIYQFSLAFPAGPAPLHYTYPIFVNSTSGVQEDILVDDVLKYETTTKTLEVGTLKYTFLDPAVSGGTAPNDATITLTAGTSLSGGGTFTTDQATNAEITFNVDTASLNIPAPSNDATITLQAGTGLNGGGAFTTNQSVNQTITFNLDAGGATPNDTAITFTAGTSLNGGGVINLNQATPETVNFDVDVASLNIPAPANDTAITFTAGTSLNGGGVINLNQATIETVNFDVDVASLNIPAPANDATITITAGTSLNGGGTFTTDQATNGNITLDVDTASLNIPAPANDTEITLTAGSFMTGGGAINLNQATPETITFNVDKTSLNIPLGAYDSTITLATTGALTGGGNFTVDASDNKTITFGTNATSLGTADTLVLRDGSGNITVNQLNYSTLSPPVSIPSPTDIFVSEDYTTNDFLPIVFASPPAFDGVKQLRHNNTDGFGYNPQLAMLVSPTTTISTYLSAPTNDLITPTTTGNGSVLLSSGTGISRSTGLTYDSATNTLSCNVSGTSSTSGGTGEADTIKVGVDTTDTVAYLTFVNSSSTTAYQQLEMNYSIYADTTTGTLRATKIRNSLGELGFTKLYDSGFSSVGSAGWFLPVNVFNTAFHSYKIIIKTSGTTQGAILQFYFADNLGFLLIDNNYDYGIMLNGGNNTDTNGSFFPISRSIVSNSRTWTVEVHNPTQSNQHTQFYSNNLYQTGASNYGQNSIHGLYTENVAWFRFGLRTSTGNMTGDMVRVYGY